MALVEYATTMDEAGWLSVAGFQKSLKIHENGWIGAQPGISRKA
jgi:hypothetical protein